MISFRTMTLIASFACAGCQEQSLPAAPDSANDTAVSGDEKVHPGLPAASGDADCEVPYSLDFAAWVHSADAIFVGEVEAVEVNRDVVFAGDEEVEFSECEPENISAGLLIRLSGVESLTSDSVEVMTVYVGEHFASTWAPQPYLEPNTQTIGWAGQGAGIGPGLRLVVAAFRDPALGVWYGAAYSLFEVDPSNNVVAQSNPCVQLPTPLIGTNLPALRTAVRAAPQPDPARLDELRAMFVPADALVRARYHIGTHCHLKDRELDPVTPDPEADAL